MLLEISFNPDHRWENVINHLLDKPTKSEGFSFPKPMQINGGQQKETAGKGGPRRATTGSSDGI
mgnify:CR=1 FL=1